MIITAPFYYPPSNQILMTSAQIKKLESEEIKVGDTVAYRNEQSGHYKGARYKVRSVGPHNKVIISLITIGRQMSELADREALIAVAVTKY